MTQRLNVVLKLCPFPYHLTHIVATAWRRDEELRVESAASAERFIEDVAFANMLTDARRAGTSFDVAVCGRFCDFGCGDPLIWAAHLRRLSTNCEAAVSPPAQGEALRALG
jgi:hypothetical protein